MMYRGIMRVSVLALFVACAPIAQVQAQSISQALTAAYEHAPELQAAVIDAKISAEGIATARSSLLPSLTGSIGANQAFSSTNGTYNGGNSSISTGLNFSQTIYDASRSGAQIEAARAAAELAEYQIRNTEQTVLLQVVQAYMNLLSARDLLTLRDENVRFYQAQLQSAQDRLDVGEGTRIDVAQAQARLAQGQAAYQAALGNIETGKASFQRLVGSQPRNLSPAHSYGNLVPRSLDAALAEAEIGHPALLLAKAAIRQADASAEVAKSAFGATASLTGNVGASWGINNSSGVGATTLSAGLGFQVTVPIYQGGRLGSGVRQANLQLIKSEVNAMSSYDQIRQAVIAGWTGIQSADAQIQAAQAAVSASTTVLDGVIQERDLGTRTTLDVLNSQADLTTARENLITASSNKVIATFTLLNAMGRLTASDLGLAVSVKTAVPYRDAVEDVWQELRSIAE